MPSLFNLSGIVLSLATETGTVTRYATDTYDVNGRAVPRAIGASLTCRLSVQPISGADRRLLPEGIDETEVVSLWSATSLVMRDRVVLERGAYEVIHLDRWEGSGAYCKAIAKKLNAGEPGEA